MLCKFIEFIYLRICYSWIMTSIISSLHTHIRLYMCVCVFPFIHTHKVCMDRISYRVGTVLSNYILWRFLNVNLSKYKWMSYSHMFYDANKNKTTQHSDSAKRRENNCLYILIVLPISQNNSFCLLFLFSFSQNHCSAPLFRSVSCNATSKSQSSSTRTHARIASIYRVHLFIYYCY